MVAIKFIRAYRTAISIPSGRPMMNENKQRNSTVFVPNAFTPNNDGNNDAWIPHINGEEFIISYECWVYDRWGKLVSNSTTIGEPWIGDNTSDGDGTHFVSSTESYSWKIELKQVDGRGAKISTGNVFLIR